MAENSICFRASYETVVNPCGAAEEPEPQDEAPNRPNYGTKWRWSEADIQVFHEHRDFSSPAEQRGQNANDEERQGVEGSRKRSRISEH